MYCVDSWKKQKTMKIITGFEPTRIITKEKGLSKLDDVLHSTNHYDRYKEDLCLVKEHGITMLRVAVPWHRIEYKNGVYNWDWMDSYMRTLEELGIEAILDPLHHVSIPSWLKKGFLDARFVSSYCKFFAMLVNRYTHVKKFTIVNEPLVTTFFCTHEGVWYPFATGKENFEEGLDNVFQAIKACGTYLEANHKEHWYIDASENHEGVCQRSIAHAEYMNKHRFRLLDRVVESGVKIDMLGLDYYAHCEFEWCLEGRKDTDKPLGFAHIANIYRKRYGLPIALTETNIRGFAEDRVTWFKYMYKQCELAGVDIMCWYPFIDCTDWDSLVTQPNGNIDPQGIVVLDEELNRKENIFSTSIKKLNKGEITIDEVPSFDFQPPLDSALKGFIETQI